MQNIKEFINKNIGLFILAISLLSVGVATGSITALNLDIEAADSLKETLGGFVGEQNVKRLDFKSIFLCECENHLRFVPLMLLCAYDYRLVVASSLIIAVKGYRIGFAISFIYSYFGAKAIILTILSVLFSYFAVIPLYLTLFVLASTYAKTRKNIRYASHTMDFKGLVISFLLVYFVLMVFAAVEGLLLPIFIGFLY